MLIITRADYIDTQGVSERELEEMVRNKQQELIVETPGGCLSLSTKRLLKLLDTCAKTGSYFENPDGTPIYIGPDKAVKSVFELKDKHWRNMTQLANGLMRQVDTHLDDAFCANERRLAEHGRWVRLQRKISAASLWQRFIWLFTGVKSEWIEEDGAK